MTKNASGFDIPTITPPKNENPDAELTRIVGACVFVALTLCLVAVWHWYWSAVQREVYRRQGVYMTQWEVFIGAEPVQRYVLPSDVEPTR